MKPYEYAQRIADEMFATAPPSHPMRARLVILIKVAIEVAIKEALEEERAQAKGIERNGGHGAGDTSSPTGSNVSVQGAAPDAG